MVKSNFHKQHTLPGTNVPPKKIKIPTEVPDQVGPYKIESLLDRGSMSLLYLGKHPTTQDLLTIKVLSEEYAKDPETVKRFLKEADIISMADHPNIVKVYAHGEWEKGLYIVMEFVRGVSLRQFIREETLSLKRSLEIALEVASALCHLHSLGIIHRDIKPENILLTESGSIKVIDFGIAQLLSELAKKKPSDKKPVAGTPMYMSPEQKSGKTVSYTSDIYSLGIIAYELIIGRLSLGTINLSLLPPQLRKILEKALKTDPKQRYQDIVELISDLSNYLKSENLKEEALQKEKYSLLRQQLNDVRQRLIVEKPPKWNKFNIGLLNHRGILLAGVYHDFFALSHNQYALVIAEPHKKNVHGLMLSASLKGMIQSLAYTTKSPVECVSILNELLYEDPRAGRFHLSYLHLNPNEHIFHYISCGQGQLFHFPGGTDHIQQLTSSNPILGEASQPNILEIKHPWNPGDLIFLQSFDDTTKKFSTLPPTLVRKELDQYFYLPPQKLVEAVFRKIRITAPNIVEDHPLALLAVSRLE